VTVDELTSKFNQQVTDIRSLKQLLEDKTAELQQHTKAHPHDAMIKQLMEESANMRTNVYNQGQVIKDLRAARDKKDSQISGLSCQLDKAVNNIRDVHAACLRTLESLQ
jgi:uncharacterized protein (UPF0305 family)